MSLANSKKTKLLRLSESICINTVADAYVRAVARVHNQRAYVKITPGSKTAGNCIKFVEAVRLTGKSPTKFMEEALAFFEPEFCQRICRKDYPMITFVISEKTLGRLIKQNKPIVKITKANFESIADQYMVVLNSMDKNMAIQSVMGGWPDGAPEVRKVLLSRLRS